MQLGLGTVQFGLNYGIANAIGKTHPAEVAEILALAAKQGVTALDTAANYGDSEAVLGAVLPSHHRFKIITKLPKLSGRSRGKHGFAELWSMLATSLTRLRQRSLYGLLVHDVNDLLSDRGIELFDAMCRFKEEKLIRKIGVSVYCADEIDRVTAKFSIDIVQIPINVLDQRLLRCGHIEALKRAGIEVHARSVFLQGLLLMDPANIPGYFDSIRPLLIKYRTAARESGLTPLQAALSFVKGVPAIDCAFVGVTARDELEEVCVAWSNDVEPLSDPAHFAVMDEQIVNPTHWPSLE